MERNHIIITIMIVCISMGFTSVPSYHVRHIIDGDTILLSTGEEVRYLSMDAPEIGYDGKKDEFMAMASRDFNRRLVGNALIRLEFDSEKKDPHKRLLAYIFLQNGDMVNALIVRKGLACVMIKRPNIKYYSLLLEQQRQAMTEKIGIWSAKVIKPEAYYIGNKGSFRFHRPACPFAGQIASKNVMRFENTHDAYWQGFSPCRQCEP